MSGGLESGQICLYLKMDTNARAAVWVAPPAIIATHQELQNRSLIHADGGAGERYLWSFRPLTSQFSSCALC